MLPVPVLHAIELSAILNSMLPVPCYCNIAIPVPGPVAIELSYCQQCDPGAGPLDPENRAIPCDRSRAGPVANDHTHKPQQQAKQYREGSSFYENQKLKFILNSSSIHSL